MSLKAILGKFSHEMSRFHFDNIFLISKNKSGELSKKKSGIP